ncbi:MAG: pirin family protein [Bacteroidota bacterium]
MKTIFHSSESRGGADHGWLKARHSFSFADFHDASRMHFGLLRVLNDDHVAAKQGFGRHPHRNMEIVTIPLEGAVAHEDSTGGKGIITPGEVQVMSAGKGVYHSEFNASATDPLKLLQLWVFPKFENIEPRYDQRKFDTSQMQNAFLTVASGEKDTPANWINQDAWFNLARLDAGKSISYKLHGPEFGAYLFVIEGDVVTSGLELGRRDAAGIWETESVEIEAKQDAYLLLIEVPMN